MEADPRAAIGRKIREIRKLRGLTQEALAERSALHWTYLGSIERGKRNVALVNIVKIARALGVRPGRLFEEFR